jgi:ribosomal protein S18 acetylase RimI-like enzyme
MMQAVLSEAGQGAEPRDGARWTFDADREKIRRATGVAFAGTDQARGEPTLAWMLSHVRFLNSEEEEERVQLSRFLMSFPLFDDWNHTSFQLCGETHDGDIISIASVQEYDTQVRAGKLFKKLRHNWNQFVTTMKLMFIYKEEVPPLFQAKERKEDLKRFEDKSRQFVQLIDEWHHTYGPQSTHWYVHIIGVTPAYQGQGRGKELMQKLNQMADRANQVMYLEAGEDNRGFYEKMGFGVAHTEILEDLPSKRDEPYPLHLMIREPKAVAAS